jgi:hypothetical protein
MHRSKQSKNNKVLNDIEQLRKMQQNLSSGSISQQVNKKDNIPSLEVIQSGTNFFPSIQSQYVSFVDEV